MRALRAQISPHFIYNSLGAIASFVRTDPDRARELLLEFADFTRYSFRRHGEYTTLAETEDRILATACSVRWIYTGVDNDTADWDGLFAGIRALMLKKFATTHSLALQQTLYAMGGAVLEEFPEVGEIRFSMPNKHHFLVDLSPFGVENPGEVFYAADRPYGLIEAEVGRDDASEPGSAWNTIPGFC